MSAKEAAFTPPDGGYGWIVVLSTILMNISLMPLVQNFGLIYNNKFKTMGVSATETSFLLHLHSAIYCSFTILGGPLLKKYSYRQVALLGTSLMSAGILLSSFANSYSILICTFALLLGLGQGIMLSATYLATNTYFKKRLTLAISFSVTGAGITNIFMPHLCNKLMEVFESTQNTVLVLAAISLIAFFCCILLKPVEATPVVQKPEVEAMVGANAEQKSVEMEELGAVYRETTLPVKQEYSLGRQIYDLFNLELLRDRLYIITIIGMSVSFASELNVLVMISFVLPELTGCTNKEVAFFLSVQSTADIIGRLVVPLIFFHFKTPPKIMYAACLITSTFGRTVLAIFYETSFVVYFCACLLGLAKGTKAVYQSVIIPKYVPLEKLPAANGLNMLLTGAASILFGPLIGAIYDVSKSYVYTLHAGSVLSMSCVGLWLLSYLFIERKLNKNVNNSIIS